MLYTYNFTGQGNSYSNPSKTETQRELTAYGFTANINYVNLSAGLWHFNGTVITTDSSQTSVYNNLVSYFRRYFENLSLIATNVSVSANANGTIASGIYTVQRGDTLAKIAAKFNTTWQALARINNLSNPNILNVGQQLKVTGNSLASASGTITNSINNTNPIITTSDVPNILNNTPPPQVKEKWYDEAARVLGLGVPVLALVGLIGFVVIFKPKK